MFTREGPGINVFFFQGVLPPGVQPKKFMFMLFFFSPETWRVSGPRSPLLKNGRFRALPVAGGVAMLV